MPTFDIEPEEITVFPIDDEYWLSHYFTRRDLFEALCDYYNEEAYRFEIPSEEFEPSEMNLLTSTSTSWSPRISSRTMW